MSDPVGLGRKEIYHIPKYPEQFKRDAVSLYQSNEDLSLHAASAVLEINRS